MIIRYCVTSEQKYEQSLLHKHCTLEERSSVKSVVCKASIHRTFFFMRNRFLGVNLYCLTCVLNVGLKPQRVLMYPGK